MNAPEGFPPSVGRKPYRPPLRWLGGKFRQADEIIAYLPPHDHYIEPYGGAGGVLLNKPRAYNEIYNDLDDELVNLFTVLRGDGAAQLLRALQLTPYARSEYEIALAGICADPIERARRLIVRSHMAHGTGGARADRPTGFRTDGISGTTNVAGEWAGLPAALWAVAERFQGVSIESRPALDLIARYSDPKWLIYLDPPYMPDTRSAKSRKAGERYHTYAHEMSPADHVALLDLIVVSKAMIVLSGYPTDLYDQRLQGWRRIERAARAHRNSPRVEVLWINPLAAERLGPGKLL